MRTKEGDVCEYASLNAVKCLSLAKNKTATSWFPGLEKLQES